MSSSWKECSKIDPGPPERLVKWKERKVTNGDGETIVEKSYPFPLYVGFILGNEFCERYAFSGMRVVLALDGN